MGDVRGENPPEERARSDTCEKVAGPPDLVGASGIIAGFGVVEGHFHELRKGNRPHFIDFTDNPTGQARYCLGSAFPVFPPGCGAALLACLFLIFHVAFFEIPADQAEEASFLQA